MKANTLSNKKTFFKQGKILWVIIVIVVISSLWTIWSYNSFVRSNESVITAWSQVESQYQRRLDLIPNFVESVKGVLAQEKEIFTAIAEARQGYAGATTVDQKIQAAGKIESSLGRLLVVVENYPILKSSETMRDLLIALEGTENRIATERGRYNDTVRLYNLRVKTFPENVFANIFGFEPKMQFESVKGAETAPSVLF